MTLFKCSLFQAAAQCYIDLIIKESDNNVKLIVLDRLIELKEHPTHERVLQVYMSSSPHLEPFVPQIKPITGSLVLCSAYRTL